MQTARPDRLSLSTKEKILRYRNVLNQVANTSYSFSKMNKNVPLNIDSLDESNGQIILEFYRRLIKDLVPTVESYKEEVK